MNPIKAAFELGYHLRRSNDAIAEDFVLAMLHDQRCYATMNDVAKNVLGLELDLPLPNKVVDEVRALRAPMSFSEGQVNSLTRQEQVLIQAEGIWLFMNRAHCRSYDNDQLNLDLSFRRALTEQQRNRFGIVEAIKFVREELGIGLLEAKSLVEAYCNPFKE